MSSRPPIQPVEHPYGAIKRCRQRRRLKIKSIKVSQLEMAETTYQECARAAQPPVYHAEHLYGLVRCHHQHGRIKFKPAKVSQSRKREMTHLGLVHSTQPPWNNLKCSQRAIGPCHQCGRVKIEAVKLEIKRVSDKTVQEVELTHLEPASTAQPPGNDLRHAYWVITPRCQCSHIKS